MTSIQQLSRDEMKRQHFSMAEVLLKAPRPILCAVREKSRHLQLKVKNSNSICHGLHGREIKAFFSY